MRISQTIAIIFFITFFCSQGIMLSFCQQSTNSPVPPDTVISSQPNKSIVPEKSTIDQGEVKKETSPLLFKILEKLIIPLIVGLIMWLIRMVYKSATQKWLTAIEEIKKQIAKLEFLSLREGVYRELDRHFINWNGLENCVAFTEGEKRAIKILKPFEKEEVQPWLSYYDQLMLSIYWDVFEKNREQGLKRIADVMAQPDVPPDIQACCLLQKARIYWEENQNNTKSIYELLEGARSLCPTNISMYFLEAKIRNETGDFEIAVNILEDIRKMPNSNLYPINIDLTLADVYISMKDYKKALNLVESYLIFHPYHVKSIKSKASIYYSDDSLPENVILQFCNQIEAINVGDDPELHYAVALLEYRLKRFDKVEKRLNSIILKKPSFIDYRFLLANIYFELNKEGELLKTLQVIKTLVTNLKLKRQVTRIIHNIEQSGIAKIKEKGQFNILLKY